MKAERPYEARVHSALKDCVILLLLGLCLMCAYLEKVDAMLDAAKGDALYVVGFFMTRVYDTAGEQTIFNWGSLAFIALLVMLVYWAALSGEEEKDRRAGDSSDKDDKTE